MKLFLLNFKMRLIAKRVCLNVFIYCFTKGMLIKRSLVFDIEKMKMRQSIQKLVFRKLNETKLMIT
jgi:hypothetical protein